MRILLGLACWLGLFAGFAVGEEPSRAFLEGLRARRDFDAALDYLKSLEAKGNPPSWFEFERGTTLLEQSSAEKNDPKKRELLVAAEAAFERYVKQKPGLAEEIRGQSSLGIVAVYRARQYMKNAEGAAEAVRADLLVAAREQYHKTIQHNEAIVGNCTAFLESPEGMADRVVREEYQKSVLQGRLLVAASTEELAEAYAADSPERQAALEKAEKSYDEIYAKYRTRLAGLYARMYQARCLQKLAKHDKALSYFKELLAVPEAPEPFRTLRMKVLELAVDSWLLKQEFAEVVDHVEPFLKSIRPNEEKLEEIAVLRTRLATAEKAIADKK